MYGELNELQVTTAIVVDSLRISMHRTSSMECACDLPIVGGCLGPSLVESVRHLNHIDHLLPATGESYQAAVGAHSVYQIKVSVPHQVPSDEG